MCNEACDVDPAGGESGTGSEAAPPSVDGSPAICARHTPSAIAGHRAICTTDQHDQVIAAPSSKTYRADTIIVYPGDTSLILNN